MVDNLKKEKEQTSLADTGHAPTSLGGVESTVSYPVLSSHIGLSAKQLKALGVSPATVRLSVGIEDADDLIADLQQALRRG